MKHLLSVSVIVMVLLASCKLIWPAPAATPDENAMQTRVAQSVAATLTVLLESTKPLTMPTHTPVSPFPTDTLVSPQPTQTPVLLPTPTAMPIPPGYVVIEERLIGPYAIHLWRNTASDSLGFDNVATISAGGQVLAQVQAVSGFGEFTGTDVTGEGQPDVVIETFSGGAHCCFSTLVYDLGPALTKVMETPQSNCSGQFEDLDGDGAFEFVTCDDLFACTYCACAFSPFVRVILQYEPGRGYVPASPRFADLYAGEIGEHTQWAQDVSPDELGSWDETIKCRVLPLVLDYLYIGQADRAWEAFDRFYNEPDAALFWAEVVQAVAKSPLYLAVGPPPVVSLPDYYMLQLLTSCGEEWQYVGLLSEGQSGCDPGVPQRDIYWLTWQLHQIGLLVYGEGLELRPAGCTTNCRLDVVRLSDNARLGSIRLDTTVGFPGEVYRVNGAESAHWRLRGNLSWERVSP